MHAEINNHMILVTHQLMGCEICLHVCIYDYIDCVLKENKSFI